MGTNQTAHPGEGVVFSNKLHSFGITALTDQAHVTGNIDARRTGHLAGGGSENVTIAGRTIVSFDVTLVYFSVLRQTL